MSPLGIQRTIAVILFLSPWLYIPNVFKDILFIVAGVLLYISTLDIRKTKPVHTHEEKTESTVHQESHTPHIPSI
jgi:hypothetical protein